MEPSTILNPPPQSSSSSLRFPRSGPSSAREFALRLTSPVSAVLSAFAGPFGGAVLAGPFSRRSALPGDGQVDLQFSRKTREEAERRKDEDVWPVFFHTEDADE